MSEPWKVIVCQTPECLAEALDHAGKVREGFHIYPELDTPEVVQFTCPRCGQTETWGATRQQVAKGLYAITLYRRQV